MSTNRGPSSSKRQRCLYRFFGRFVPSNFLRTIGRSDHTKNTSALIGRGNTPYTSGAPTRSGGRRYYRSKARGHSTCRDVHHGEDNLSTTTRSAYASRNVSHQGVRSDTSGRDSTTRDGHFKVKEVRKGSFFSRGNDRNRHNNKASRDPFGTYPFGHIPFNFQFFTSELPYNSRTYFTRSCSMIPMGVNGVRASAISNGKGHTGTHHRTNRGGRTCALGALFARGEGRGEYSFFRVHLIKGREATFGGIIFFRGVGHPTRARGNTCSHTSYHTNSARNEGQPRTRSRSRVRSSVRCVSRGVYLRSSYHLTRTGLSYLRGRNR